MELLRALADVLAPPTCLVCGRRGVMPWCASCATDVRRRWTWDGRLALGGVNRAQATFRYQGEVADAIVRGKLRGLHAVWRPCGRMLRLPREAEVIVPVPSDPGRVRARGFDHTARLAEGVRDVTGLPVVAAVAAPADTTDRGRDRRDRQARRWPVRLRLDGARVLIVDDVITTGMTAQEVAAACRRAGAARVEVSVVGATPRPDRFGRNLPTSGLRGLR